MEYNTEEQFKKLLEQLMGRDSRSILSPNEIYFESLVTDVIELIGDNHIVWMN